MGRRTARFLVAGSTVWILACAGLFGSRVTETDGWIGEPSHAIPVPSTELARGFDGPPHRARVADALCAGSIPVWGEVTQAVVTSHRQGELHDDITRRYSGLVQRCEQPGYCGLARQKLQNTDGEVHAFWLHVLATCGDLRDRPTFRDLDLEPNAVATFYTAGTEPMHREGADEGALILAVERLVQRGSPDEPLPTAIRALLGTDHPEAAERLAALVPDATLNVQDMLYEGLAGQSHPSAVAAVDAYCERVPDKGGPCHAGPKPTAPDHARAWLDALARATDPDRATGMLEVHPELREQAVPHLRSCGASCAGAASLVDGDDALFARADEAGISPRPDRMGQGAFDDHFAAVLLGRGRLTGVDTAIEGPVLHERIGRAIARLASPDLDEAWFHALPGTETDPRERLALEIDQHHYEVALDELGDHYDLDGIIALVDHALEAAGSAWTVVRLAGDGQVADVAALPRSALASLEAEGLVTVSRPE